MHEELDRLNVLADPVRRSLYDHVVAVGAPVTRDDAADAARISRSLAAYHLDKLVEEGLLESGFETDRPGGPGSGRPAKVYTRASTEVALSLPPRDDELAARLLAEAVETAGAGDAAREAARREGRTIGEEARRRLRGRADDRRRLSTLSEVLAEHGYEPHDEVSVGLTLRNCPFDHLTGEHRDLVCGMNLALLEGVVEGLGIDRVRAVLDPQPGRCCVTVPVTSPAPSPGPRPSGGPATWG